MNNVVVEKVVINNPIGNLYRKRHVLVLVVDKDSNFVLGKKKDFYPDHVARMLGGGIKDDEDPKVAAKREIEEELLVNIPIESFKELCSVITKASTSEGDMVMQTWVYSVQLPDSADIKPSDDITGIQIFTQEQYEKLIKDIMDLSGDFVTDKFSFSWTDWGKIYGPIHKYALDRFRETENKPDSFKSGCFLYIRKLDAVIIFAILALVGGGVYFYFNKKQCGSNEDCLQSIFTEKRQREFTVYFKGSVSESDVLLVKNKIENRSEIKSLKYISSEQAAKDFNERNKDDKIVLDGLKTALNNPFPSKFEIKIKNVKDRNVLIEYIKSIDTSSIVDRIM